MFYTNFTWIVNLKNEMK